MSGGPGVVKAGITRCGSVQFSKRVRNLMKECGLTIRKASLRWGYADSTIKEWRAGKSEPSWSTWEAIERRELEALGRTGT